MAWSVFIWKIYGFPKVSLYLERFVLKHATAHIQKRSTQFEKLTQNINPDFDFCFLQNRKKN